MNILLMGLRGSGKSTLGRALADRLDLPFVDLDERVLSRFREPTVHEVWAACGESAWRDAEAATLAATLRDDGQVIALGGGTPLIERAQLEAAQRRGAVTLIYLRCPAQTLIQRLQHSPGDRPSLTGKALAEEVGEMLARREPTFLALADITYRAEVQSVAESCDDLVRLIAERGSRTDA